MKPTLLLLPFLVFALTFSSAQDSLHLSALQQQAERGDSNSQYMLGSYYADPQFLMRTDPGASKRAPDYVEAFKWLTRSAVQGDIDALISLGEMYENGEGVEENATMAALFYRQGCELVATYRGGVGVACMRLALLYDQGSGVQQDGVEAYKYAFVADEISGAEAKKIAAHLTPVQLNEAQRRIKDWYTAHPATDPERH